MSRMGTVEYVSNMADGPGVRTTSAFLKGVVNNLFKYSKEYLDHTNELPLVYQERQLLPLLGSAIRGVTPVFLGEAPINRASMSNRGMKSHGWVDFFASYRQVSYFIEVKHSFFSYKSKRVRTAMAEKWGKAIDQLLGSKKELRESWNITNNFFLVSLMVVPFYSIVKEGSGKEFNFTREELEECRDEIISSLSPRRPNWHAMCYLHKDSVGPYKYKKYCECHPAVGVYAHIFK